MEVLDFPPQSAKSSRGSLGGSRSSLHTAGTLHGEESVRVVVRVRPPNRREEDAQDNRGIATLDDARTIAIAHESGQKNLSYDHVYPEPTTQQQMFDDCGVVDIIDRAVAGYSATVFAFGQTGSGKTFTMTGPPTISSPDHYGIIPRALRHLFEVIAANPNVKYTVRAAYLEIYNEAVQDLLNPSAASLPVRWKRNRGFYVENLFVVECEVLDDCLAVLEEGLRNRTTGAHALNERSSRSHSILTVYIESEEDPTYGDSSSPGSAGSSRTLSADGDLRPTQKFGKISFVDLAGSERVKDSKTTGEALTETFNINRSLLVLGNCISALSDAKKKLQHVPYRDSKLTKLLMDSLGGNGLALMIACVSPSAQVLSETVQTLRYASRAKRIRNRPVVQMDPREELIAKLKAEVKRLRTENEQLRGTFEGGGGGAAPNDPRLASYYGAEMDALKHEHTQLLIAKQRADIAYASLMRENEQLRNQLERTGGGPESSARTTAPVPHAMPLPASKWVPPSNYAATPTSGSPMGAPVRSLAAPQQQQQQQRTRAPPPPPGIASNASSRHNSISPAPMPPPILAPAAAARAAGPPTRSPAPNTGNSPRRAAGGGAAPTKSGGGAKPSSFKVAANNIPPSMAMGSSAPPHESTVPDLHVLRQDVSWLDAEIAKMQGT